MGFGALYLGIRLFSWLANKNLKDSVVHTQEIQRKENEVNYQRNNSKYASSSPHLPNPTKHTKSFGSLSVKRSTSGTRQGDPPIRANNLEKVLKGYVLIKSTNSLRMWGWEPMRRK